MQFRFVVLSGVAFAVLLASQTLRGALQEGVNVSPIPGAVTAFDVATIRPTSPDSTATVSQPSINGYLYRGATLQDLIEYAYDVDDFQVTGGPKWIRSLRFDINARVDGSHELPKHSYDRALEQLIAMRLQSLLSDRFSLKVHAGTMDAQVYTLHIEKGGTKLPAAKEANGFTEGYGSIESNSMSMDEVASMISTQMHQRVINQTGLSGEYSISLHWNPTLDTQKSSSLPDIFTALKEQMGLKLTADKQSINTIVIDKVEQPTSN
jgi:bla regulator protein blaR1